MVASAAYGQLRQGQHGCLLKYGAVEEEAPVHVAVCKGGQAAVEHILIKQYVVQPLVDVNIQYVLEALLPRHVVALGALAVQAI